MDSLKLFLHCCKMILIRRTKVTISAITVLSIFLISSSSIESSYDSEPLSKSSELYTIVGDSLVVKHISSNVDYSHISRGDFSWITGDEEFFNRLQNEEPTKKCKKLVSIGGNYCNKMNDGAKMVCLDEEFNIRPKNCIGYSVGVSTDISFDLKMAKFGCKMFLMDPTLPPYAYKWMKGNLEFYPYGLSSANMTFTLNITNFEEWQGVKDSQLFPFDVLRRIIGHSNGTVHILKMDIEGSEWPSLENMIANNLLEDVQQIAVEMHFSQFTDYEGEQRLEFLKQKWSLIEKIEEQGFRRVFYEPTKAFESIYNIPGTNRTILTCGEFLFVRNYPTLRNKLLNSPLSALTN